jgi:uncharacterized membrane protein YphA (DoxX/SURF4 family)
MLQSLKLSNLIIRVGLALVFLWFGIDKFFHPDYWINAWLPQIIVDMVTRTGMSAKDFMYLIGIFELLVAISMLTNVFARHFAFLAVVFLLSLLAFHGLKEVIIRDVGLIGGFLAIIFWPTRRYI